MNRFGYPGRHAVTIASALLIAVLGVTSVFAQALGPAGPSPAQENANVVTHALVDIPGGSTVWRIRNLEVNAETPPLAAEVPAFVTTEEVPVLVENLSSGLRQRVASGEAAVLPGGTETQITSLGPPQTVLIVDMLPVDDASLSGSPGRISSAFQMEASTYDVDVIRVQLAEEETSIVPMGNGPSLIVGRSGQVDVQTDDEQFSVGDSSDRLTEGEMTLTATSDSAIVLVVRIGPEIEPSVAQATPETTELLPDPEPTEVPATPEPATPEPTVVPSTPEPVEDDEPQDIDSDGDGLENSDEIALGTDPDVPDTDGDGLTDLEEILLETDPLSPDTDEDGVSDGDEQELGIDPLNSDTDADILYDGGELIYGTDPLIVDTDGDGLSDGEEVYFTETSPTTPDTDGDGATDPEEVNAGTDPLDPAEFP